MATYLYGEDALTQIALPARLGELLKLLDDVSLVEDCDVFIRPSFGRRGGTALRRAASFGEFDAIVATGNAVYLIETKWSRSSETWRKDKLILREEQIRRHRVFRWYLECWRRRTAEDWSSFRAENLAAFEQEFESQTIAPENSTLANNLLFVLRKLSVRAGEIRDVVLFCDIDGEKCPIPEMAHKFDAITMSFGKADVGGFISQGDASTPCASLMPETW